MDKRTPDKSPKLAKTGQVEKFFYSRQEAAFALALSVRAVDSMIADTRLRTRRFGSRVLIPAEDVRAVAEEILKHDMLQGTGQRSQNKGK